MISRYKDVLYRVGAEIAYKMYATGNKKLYVTQDDLSENRLMISLKICSAKSVIPSIIHNSSNPSRNKTEREEWIEKYRKVCDREEFPRLDRILGIEDDSSDGICDTPLAFFQ